MSPAGAGRLPHECHRCLELRSRRIGGRALERISTVRTSGGLARGVLPLPRILSGPAAGGARRLTPCLRIAGPRGANEIRRWRMAILVADIAGYSRLIEADDVVTVVRLRCLRGELIEPAARPLPRRPDQGLGGHSPARLRPEWARPAPAAIFPFGVAARSVKNEHGKA
jgi:hypothetical protein